MNAILRLMLAVAPTVAIVGWPGCLSAQTYSLMELPTLGGDPASTEATGINGSGQVTGWAPTSLGNTAVHAFLYGNGVMQDLGTLGGAYSFGQAINDAGQVAGSSGVNGSMDPTSHVFLYSGVMQNLGNLGGPSPTASITGINSSGQIIGLTINSSNQTVAFVTANGALTPINPLGGGSAAFGINDAGQVTGFAVPASNSGPQAFLYSNGVARELGTLGGTSSTGIAINSSGQVAGNYAGVPGSGAGRAFLYSEGTMRDLGSLGGNQTSVMAINASGEVTGIATVATGYYHAFVYAGSAIHDLGTLGGLSSESAAIDSAGDVVGAADMTNVGARAFLYTDSSLTALNSHIDPSSPLAMYTVLTYAKAITDTGYILAQGVDSQTGVSDWYVLREMAASDPSQLPGAAWLSYVTPPVPTPAALPASVTLLLSGLGSLGIVVANRRAAS